MELLDAIRKRHSVRQYKETPIEQEIINELEREIELINKEGDLNFQLVLNEPEAFSGRMAHYGNFSGVKNYFNTATSAVLEMQKQVGGNIFDENGIMQKGLIVRHLVLPGNVSQAFRVMDWVKTNLPYDTILSLMSQYTPCANAAEYPTINRKLSEREYNLVLDYAEKLGFENVFIQEPESSSTEFIPAFDLSGI